jgi:hypothetical protein
MVSPCKEARHAPPAWSGVKGGGGQFTRVFLQHFKLINWRPVQDRISDIYVLPTSPLLCVSYLSCRWALLQVMSHVCTLLQWWGEDRICPRNAAFDLVSIVRKHIVLPATQVEGLSILILDTVHCSPAIGLFGTKSLWSFRCSCLYRLPQQQVVLRPR